MHQRTCHLSPSPSVGASIQGAVVEHGSPARGSMRERRGLGSPRVSTPCRLFILPPPATMSRLASEFAKGLRGLKVKELAPYVGGFARSNLTPTTLYRRAYEHLHTATKAELDAGSVRPLFTTMGGLFVAAYVLAWPQVRDARGGGGGE